MEALTIGKDSVVNNVEAVNKPKEQVRFTGKPIVKSEKPDKLVSLTETEVKPKPVKATKTEAVQLPKKTNKVPVKAAKGAESTLTNKPEVKAISKNKHEGSFAQFMDNVCKAGGTWEALLATLKTEAEKRECKVYTLGGVKAHIKFRLSKDANFFGALQASDNGFFPLETKATKAKSTKKAK